MTTMEFVKSMGNGWNLGDTLDAIKRDGLGGDGAMAQKNADHETAWFNPLTQKGLIDAVSAAGFTTLRIPVSWGMFVAGAPDYRLNPERLERAAQIADWGIAAGMRVILNLHHEQWHTPNERTAPTAKAVMTKLWTQIAERFKRYDNDKLIFETMNEPRLVGTPLEWSGGDAESRAVINDYNAAALAAIRATCGNNATRKVMLPTYAANGDEHVLADYVFPKDENCIVSIHSYTPYPFALSKSNDVRLWSKENPADREPIDSLFERLNRHFISKGIPVIMGETGCVNRDGVEALKGTPEFSDGKNYPCRVEWAKYFTGKARELGIPCVWWDNGKLTGRGENFSIIDRNTFKNLAPELISAFLGVTR